MQIGRSWRTVWCAVAVFTLGPGLASAQKISYRGFLDAGFVFYPQEAPNDDTHVVADAVARFEPTLQLRPGISVAASLEARTDTYQMGGAGVRYWDRTLRRPVLAARTLTATLSKGPVSLEVGKQFVRWGQSDIVSPTDYFTARDYVVTVTSEVLGLTAARLTVGDDNDSVDVVYAPRVTPSRMPLLDQRWIGAQTAATGFALADGDTRFSHEPQVGVRYRRTGPVEYSVSVFQGPHHLPLLDPSFRPQDGTIVVGRYYPEVRGYGGDLVATTPLVTVKAEAAWLQARSRDADDYGLWVVQGEHQRGEWLLLGGYVGEWVTETRGLPRFAPDRGLARSVIGRVSRNFDDGRTLAVEGLLRKDGDGVYLKTEYSHPYTGRLRVTVQLLLIGGQDGDFLGQYRRNSLTGARARYSF